MNVEGMRRKGWSKDVIHALRQAFKLIYKEGLTTEQAIQQIRAEILPEVPEVQLLVDSLEQSKRGIVR
jgi:UDP-N-acetylglucosamine acyltransferase